MEEAKEWFTWKSGADCTSRWRRQPAPRDPNRDAPYVSAFWVPPSEDPYYKAKWADWRRRFAMEEPEPAQPVTKTPEPVQLSTARRMRGIR